VSLRSPLPLLAFALALAPVAARAADDPHAACKAAAAEAQAQPPAATAAAATSVTLEDLVLTDQDGRPARFRSEVVGDRLVVLDFVFTTCTTICPVLSSRMARLQEALGDRLGREVLLVSVSVDPVRDTPARLLAYAAKWSAKPGWRFLTGPKADVDAVLKGLGAWTADYADHRPMFLVGDGRTGRFLRLNGFPGADDLLRQVDGLAAARPAVAAAPPPAADPEDERARAWFTDTELVTQEGKRVRFYTDVLRDKVVVVDLIFTRCAGACPVLTAKLAALRRELGELFGSKVRFVSVSIDPAFDTPQELAAFARKHGAEHPEWLFLTGGRDDVKAVVSRLGQWTDEVGEHSTIFIAGNARRRHWTKIRLDTATEAFALQVRKLVGEDVLLAPSASAAVQAR
jgi:cytochrome oxidase Cu insertion factor (SCO1/SenC/PrrC family)